MHAVDGIILGPGCLNKLRVARRFSLFADPVSSLSDTPCLEEHVVNV